MAVMKDRRENALDAREQAHPRHKEIERVVTVRTLEAAELTWANARYAEVSFKPSTAHDLLALACVEGQRAGLGRLVQVGDASGELGGIYVLPDHRGKQVARALVSFLLEQSPYPTLYCIPFAHLDAFYRGFGFAPAAAASSLPRAVADKVAWCATQYAEPVSLLVRTAQ